MTILPARINARTFLLSASAVALATCGLPVIKGAFAIPEAAAQGVKGGGSSAALPKPYVSRAIDATLMELTPAARSQFGIKPNVKGVLVISTQPGGIAAQNNILPGDVITDIRGRRVDTPIDVDTHVLYWLKKGDTAFQFVGNRGGNPYNTAAQITLALFDAVIDLATIASWSAWDYGGWSYASYYEEYSTVIVEEYSYSETVIEETIESSSFETEMTTEESYEETTETSETTTEETSETTEESSEETSESSEEASESSDEADESSDEADDQSDNADEGDEADDGDQADEADEGDDADEADDSGGDEADEGDDGGDDDSGDEGDDGGDDDGGDDGGDEGGDE